MNPDAHAPWRKGTGARTASLTFALLPRWAREIGLQPRRWQVWRHKPWVGTRLSSPGGPPDPAFPDRGGAAGSPHPGLLRGRVCEQTPQRRPGCLREIDPDAQAHAFTRPLAARPSRGLSSAPGPPMQRVPAASSCGAEEDVLEAPGHSGGCACRSSLALGAATPPLKGLRDLGDSCNGSPGEPRPASTYPPCAA